MFTDPGTLAAVIGLTLGEQSLIIAILFGLLAATSVVITWLQLR